MRSIMLFILSFSIFILLSGCLYPDERRPENQVPYEDQIQSVQSAVIQFRQDHGRLPIIERENTDVFRKYQVNFAPLIPNYLQSPPGNSFESGGVFQYVLINIEEMPEVKLIHLPMIREIQEFQQRVDMYRRENQYAPVDQIVGKELLRLDYEELNYSEQPTVDSPYHPDHRLPLLLQNDGTVIIDYTIDILYFIEEHGLDEFDEGDDLRWLLVKHAPFVPVYSRPMTLIDGEIVFN
ncbi:hypothetical protein [Evansella cellulosilytica]|uniref:ABC transporter periplasmic binding protein yphF n=1 Tax=Evansella cellulosilytica (strain ATCC 21833 / DSM 2522 / FERM P-1141 / JCM 9156 / N-4) TaxID=649639 RepID=E6TZE8_EVAC2|nr:hypothetical protein [Evansella cellulosilytica]ADU30122.1 hypothetical protein Bcell_1860 [Evansella cellulosilytica DSM 2522]